MVISSLANITYSFFASTASTMKGVAPLIILNVVTSKMFPTYKETMERNFLAQQLAALNSAYRMINADIVAIKNKITIVDENNTKIIGKVSNFFKFAIRCLTLGIFYKNTEKSALESALTRHTEQATYIEAESTKIGERVTELAEKIRAQDFKKTLTTLFIVTCAFPLLSSLFKPNGSSSIPTDLMDHPPQTNAPPLDSSQIITTVKNGSPSEIIQLATTLITQCQDPKFSLRYMKGAKEACGLLKRHISPDADSVTSLEIKELFREASSCILRICRKQAHF